MDQNQMGLENNVELGSNNAENNQNISLVEQNIDLIQDAIVELKQENESFLKEKEEVLPMEGFGSKVISKRSSLMKVGGALLATNILGGLILGCTPPGSMAAMVDGGANVEKPSSENIQENTPEIPLEEVESIPTETPTLEPTATPEIILPDVDNSWTYEEMDKVLVKWKYGLKESVEAQKTGKKFFYYVAGEDHWAVYGTMIPYEKRMNHGASIAEWMRYPDSQIINKDLWDSVFGSLYREEFENGSFSSDKDYEAIFYVTLEEDEYGQYNGFYLKDGGYYRIEKEPNDYDGDGIRVTYIAPDEVSTSNLTKQEIDWIGQGYTQFDYRFGEDGVGRAKDPRGANLGNYVVEEELES